MRKKIALLFNKFENMNFTSGGEKVNYYIVKALQELGYEIDIYCNETNVSDENLLKNIFFPKGHAIYQNKREEYLCAFSEHFSPLGNFTYIHENTRHYRNKYTKSFIGKIAQCIFFNNRYRKILKQEVEQKRHVKNVKKFLVPSEFIKKDVIEAFGVKEEQVVIIPPYSGDIERTDFCKEEYDVFTFGLSGRGFAHKGGYEFIFAIILLKLFGYKIKAKIIYPFSPSAKKLKKLLLFLGLKNDIEILDYCSNMNDFYSKIDCLVMASKREAFGLVAIEAIARNIPVIINDRCGVKDFIKDGVNGFVYSYNHPLLNLFKSMKYLLNHKHKISVICTEALSVIEELSFENFKKKLNAVLEEYEKSIN